MIIVCSASLGNYSFSLLWVAEGGGNSFSLGTGFTPVGSWVRPCGETFSGVTFCQGVGKSRAGFAAADLGGPGLGARLLSSNPTVPLAGCGAVVGCSPSLRHQFLTCQTGITGPTQGA